MAGDIFTMYRTNRSGVVIGGHTGFVIRYDAPARRIETIEGNTRDSVMLRTRSLTEVDGFIRLGR